MGIGFRCFLLWSVLCSTAASPVLAWNGKQDILGIAVGMSPEEVHDINESCRVITQSHKVKLLWSADNEPGEMQCQGRDGILRIQFTRFIGPPKAYSVIYYFASDLNSFDEEASIERQYQISNSYPQSLGSGTIYIWQTNPYADLSKGVNVFLATFRSSRDYVLRITDGDAMMDDYNSRPRPAGPKF